MIYKNMFIKYIKSDLYRYAGNTSLKSFLKIYISNRGFNFIVWLRICSHGGLWSKFAYPIFWLKRNKYGIEISPSTKIGYGFYIGHNGPVTINHSAQLGNNVNLSQFTVIGSNTNNAASIGNNVYIGPNVCIVENVKIGSNVQIGAGSVVTKDIPDNSIAVGNYAKVIKENKETVFNYWNEF